MSATLKEFKLIENCTPSIAYDAQIKAACAAIDRQCQQILDDTPQVIMIPNIMGLTDAKLVDILAWQFHVDFYDPTRDLEFRKRLVQMSIVWHKTKGTMALVQEVIDTYWPGTAYLQEWFEYASWGAQYQAFRPQDVNPTQDKFNLTGHTLLESQQIWFELDTGTALPAPFTLTDWYYTVNVTSTSFQVAATVGGTPIDITDSGVGNNKIGVKVPGTGLPPNYPHPGWHDRYRFRVVIQDDVVDPEVEAQVVTLIDRYKPVSRWPEPNLRPRPSGTTVYATAYAMIFITRISKAPTNYIPRPT